MYKVIICDDNKSVSDLLTKLLEKYEETYHVEVKAFYDGESLLDYCSHNAFDIIYMDIALGNGKQNGMEVAKQLKAINPKVLIIYISAYDNYYVDMVNAEPFRFIMKDASDIPKLERDLETALMAALKRINNQDTFTYKFDRAEYTIEISKIRYFYSVTRTIHIVGELEGIPSYFYGKLNDLYDELRRKDCCFLQVNKSVIVNMKYVIISNANQVMIGNKKISVTKKYRKELKGFQKIIKI